MPPIPGAIGGFEARRESLVSPDVSQNLLPEILDPETDFRERRRIAMLPTRGYRRFLRLPASSGTSRRITGIGGTREIDERMAVSAGRRLNLLETPEHHSPAQLLESGTQLHTDVVVRPVYGAYEHLAGETYYAVGDGTLRCVSNAIPEPRVVDISDVPSRWTPIGVAGDRATGYVWISCAEDRLVRAFGRSGDGLLNRANSLDLELSASDVAMPESLWFYSYSREKVMAVVDGIGGEVFLYRLVAVPRREWVQASVHGTRNPLTLQLAAGNPDSGDRRPVQPGGVWMDSTTVVVVSRSDRKVYTFSRVSGDLRSVADLHSELTAGGRVPCGFLGGAGGKVLYTDADQVQTGTKRRLSDGTIPGGAPELLAPRSGADFREREYLVPLDETGRYMAWAVDRKLHLIDLQKNRVILNVAGNVDQVTATGGRFVGVDSPGGTLAASPPGAVLLTENATRLSVETSASIVVPRLPAAGGSKAKSVAVTVSNVYVTTHENILRIYDRNDLQDPFVEPDGGLSPTRRTYSQVAVSGAPAGTGSKAGQICIAVVTGSPASLDFRFYDRPPMTKADLEAPAETLTTGSVPNGITSSDQITAMAFDDSYVFVILDDGTTKSSRMVTRSGRTPPTGDLATAGRSLHMPTTWDGSLDEEGYEVRGIDMAGGILRAAIFHTSEPTRIRALYINRDTLSAKPRQQIEEWLEMGPTSGNTSLTHDGNFLYDVAAGQAEDLTLRDGTHTTAVTLVPFWLRNPYSRSAYRWRPETRQFDTSSAVSSLRGAVYAFSRNSYRVYLPDPEAEGFPFRLYATRDIGCAAPHSIAHLRETLHWIGANEGGGLRAWKVGGGERISASGSTLVGGDLEPEEILSPAVEEVLDLIGENMSSGIGWTDDSGGHPCYVVGWRIPGVTLCYDAAADAWHTRTSLRLPGDEGDPFNWQDAEQGHLRVEHSTLWRNRQFVGGYGGNNRDTGYLAEPSLAVWTDIDGGAVQRRRAFAAPLAERRRVRYNALRVDVAYDVGDAEGTEPGAVDPQFSFDISNDGGRRWVPRGVRHIGGRRPPRPFYRLGNSRSRAYRITSTDPGRFTILGVYIDVPSVAGKM